MTPSYPIDSLQYHIGGPWWEETPKATKERWRLGWALVRHVAAEAYEIIPRGRTVATEHHKVDIDIARFDASKPAPSLTGLPLAGMPVYRNERIAVQRAKMRPVLIIASPGCVIEEAIRKNICKSNHCPTYLVAPYYGVDQDGSRAGIPDIFVQRIKQFCYSQYFWDSLPLNGPNASVLRLDQLQPIEPDLTAWKSTKFKLSSDASVIMDQWLHWHLTQEEPSEDSLFCYFRTALQEMPTV